MRLTPTDWRRNRLLGAQLSLIAFSASAGWLDLWKTPTSLAGVEAQVERDIPNVGQLQADELAAQTRLGALIILDVREPEVFAVSDLAGARLIAPGASI